MSTMVSAEPGAADEVLPRPSFAELVATFARVGVFSFGGAAGQIAMMHGIVVDEKKWLSETAFQHALNYCMLLPGPEAQQLATYIGWLTHGVRGGLAAGVLFVAPGALVMMGLAALYVLASGLAVVEGLFFGVKAAVLAIVVHALLKIAKRGLRTRTLYGLAFLAFALILLLDAPFPLIVIGAGVIGAVLAATWPELVGVGGASLPSTPVDPARARGALLAAAACLLAWWAPVAIAAHLLGGGHLVTQVGLFFSKLAVVTFGGAYALLAYLSQSAVEMGWVTDREMIDGLGLAETTPGPTILVNQFVAFLAGWRAPEPLGAAMTATLAASMAVWVTFAPSFLWIFAGAPYLERLRRSPRAAGALAGITAAVVGVIAYLALWFALNVLFREVGTAALGQLRLPAPRLASIDLAAAALTLAAFAVMFLWRRGVMTTVALLGAAGIAVRLAGL